MIQKSTYLSTAVMSKQNLFSMVSDVRRMQDASVKVSLLLCKKEKYREIIPKILNKYMLYVLIIFYFYLQIFP